MEQVEYIAVPEAWNDIDDLLTSALTSGNQYQIECRGGNSGVLLQEAASKPAETDLGGVFLDPKGQKTVEHTVGTNGLYVRGLDGNAHINVIDITVAEE